jgi:type II secretory pathway pseudopilin PulG
LTLIELMMVVTIMMLLALSSGPRITRAIAEHRKERSVRTVSRVGVEARGYAIGNRRAYLMWVQYGGSNDVAPKIQLLRAATSSCISQNWTAIQAQCGTAHDDGLVLNGAGKSTHLNPCVANFDFGTDASYATGGYTIRAVEEDVSGNLQTANRAICFSPDGVIYTANSLTMTTLNSYNTVGGAIKILFRLRDSKDNFVGVQQRVVIPIVGAPKVLQ